MPTKETAHDQYEKRARAWDEAGRPRSMLVIDDYELMSMWCWITSTGGQSDGVSETLHAYNDASRARLPSSWSNDYLSQRDSCQRCGESYRIENLMLCTHCYGERYYCHGCYLPRAKKSPNGNSLCACGGELVG